MMLFCCTDKAFKQHVTNSKEFYTKRGPVEPASWNRVESARLNFPPHKPPSNQRLRLACQVRCLGDLEVEKFDEFWGQGAIKLPELQPGEGSWSLGAAEFVLDRDAWRSREGNEDQAQL